jgi:hypothetical protein
MVRRMWENLQFDRGCRDDPVSSFGIDTLGADVESAGERKGECQHALACLYGTPHTSFDIRYSGISGKSIKVVSWTVKAKWAPNAAAGLSAPLGGLA